LIRNFDRPHRPHSPYVLPIVNDFLAAYPELKVRLVLSDHSLNLVTDHIDLAVRVGSLPDSSLVATQLGTTCRVVCGSPGYFKAHGAPKSLADLANHACISFEVLAQGPAWKFAQSSQRRTEKAVQVRPRLVVNTAEAAVDAAIAGVGLAPVLSYQAWPAWQAGQLKLVLREFDPDPVPVSFVYTAQRLLPPKSRLFLDNATPRLRKVLEKLMKKESACPCQTRLGCRRVRLAGRRPRRTSTFGGATGANFRPNSSHSRTSGFASSILLMPDKARCVTIEARAPRVRDC
jgi:DNA-binding transcriptional LysR family regulator